MSIPWDLKKMYWHNGAKMTAKRLREENQKRLEPEVIKRINSNLEKLAEADSTTLHEPRELAEWQKEIMEQEVNED